MNTIDSPRVRRSIPWRALSRAQALVDGHVNDVAIEPEVVPIIFVPGIMGTRLTSNRGMVWDPDDAVGFCINFGLRFADLPARMEALLGVQGYEPHHLWLPDRGAALTAGPSWTNLVQSSYGALQRSLQTMQTSPAIKLCLHMPQHAFAYNWTQSPEQSGKRLQAFIARIIAAYQGDHLCRKVLLVTHSMGGLVARAATQLHGAAPHVLGVVHAMMPTAGAPVMYQRMKLGFSLPQVTGTSIRATEFVRGSLFAALMGATGTGVARVLGHMPGALSLLPSGSYGQGDALAGWLTLQHTVDGPIEDQLPRRADPYDEIYRRQVGPSRLFDVPPNCHHWHRPCQQDRCWHGVDSAIDEVEHLHRRLGHNFHPNSHHIVGTKLRTPTQARFYTRPDALGTMGMRLDAAAVPGRDAHPPVELSAFMGQHDDGDGTVPAVSALAGLHDAARYTCVAGVEHSMAMAAPEVLAVVHARIRDMAHAYIAAGLTGEPA